jgi:lipid-A-disaccharide synthase
MPVANDVRDILFVAGEASGDLHAGNVAKAIRQRAPSVRMRGIGGQHMAAAGVELVEQVDKLAVMGFVEVLQHVPRHWLLLRQLTQEIQSGRIGLVVLVDYPGFNLKVAAAAKAAGVPVLYYVAPQVWAWGADRLPRIAELVTKAACILPFEEALLRTHGVDATFVGHPLLDRAQSLPSQAEARASLGLPVAGNVVAMFPGSRRAEIARHLEPFTAAAHELQRMRPDIHVVVGVAPTVRITAADVPFPLVHDASFPLLRAASVGMLKSGTTTLEAAVAGLPHIIGYRTNALTYQIARRVVKIPHIGLVNVVAGREVSREFVQEKFVPSVVAQQLASLLDDGAGRSAALLGLSEVRAKLGTPGAAERVAQMALGLLQ